MMLLRVISLAVWAAIGGVSAVQAQSAVDFGGPAEMPPASFTGQQFVDSRGCVFLRAGYGGRVNWVQRVGSDRRPLCGYPATFGARPVIEVAEPAPAPRATGRKPVETVATLNTPPTIRETPTGPRVDPATYAAPRPVNVPPATIAPVAVAPAPVVVARPVAAPASAPRVGGYKVVENTTPGPGKIGCFTHTPVAEVVKLTNGGTAVVCTKGDGTTTGWRSPIYPQGSGSGPALNYPQFRATEAAPRGYARSYEGRSDYVVAGETGAVGHIPEGYRAAWKDDRLNPNRGIGTAAGQAAQDRVWTRDVPARLVAGADTGSRRQVVVVRRQPADVTVSTKNQPREVIAQPQKAAPKAQARGGAYIQIGTFGVPSNAEGAASRLAGMGMPVGKSNIQKGGRALQIVYAGPFASASDAQAALGAARRAGFPDAFIR